MKTNIILIAAFAATSMFLFSCNKDKDEISNQEGNPTAMTVAINFPQPATRATNDPYGTEDESKIYTVDVFIYNSTNGAFVSHTHLNAGDFTYKPDGAGRDHYVYNAAAKIPTTTGAKIVFAGINMPNVLVVDLDGKHVSALSNTVRQMSMDDLTGFGKKYVMFSVRGVPKVFAEDETFNNVTLECQRLVAKVTVEQASDMKQDGVEGKLKGLEYVLNGINKKQFLLNSEAPFKDPNWAIGSYNKEEFVNYYKIDDVYNEVAVFGTKSPYSSEPLYASENTSEGKTKKELTRSTVRGQFIPEKIAIWNAIEKTITFEDNPNFASNTYASFHAVVVSITDGTYYFGNKPMADAFATFKNEDLGYAPGHPDYIEAFTYTNGYCYWDIFLNRNALNAENRWDVLRNDFYRCKIARITTPGRSGPELDAPGGGGGPENPDKKPDYDTNITVDIEILNWHVVDVTEYDLY